MRLEDRVSRSGARIVIEHRVSRSGTRIVIEDRVSRSGTRIVYGSGVTFRHQDSMMRIGVLHSDTRIV